MLSYYSMFLLRKLFSNIAVDSTTGVLRGMNISATLSEIYLRKFDKWIKNCAGVYFYARFVDDIVIFVNNEKDARFLLDNLNQKLEELAEGLTINKNKTQLFNGLKLEQLDLDKGAKINKEHYLEYLGYKFMKEKTFKAPQKCRNCGIDTNKPKEEIKLKVSIADRKIKKIKSRIALSFADYLKTKNFFLLNDRMKFLTGNYSIKKRNDEDSDLRAGIFFNYSQLSDFEVLNELNQYYRKFLFAKNGTFGTKLNSKLSSAQKERLKKYCFRSGFAKKIYNAFDYSRMSEIVSCW